VQLVAATKRVGRTGWYGQLLANWRMRLVLQLLPGRVNRLLQLAYGDGRFMPELDTRANQLFGIDAHPFAEEVQDRLRLNGVQARLSRGLGDVLTYDDHYFDRIVIADPLPSECDLENVSLELARVLAPSGKLLLAVPALLSSHQLNKVWLRSYELVDDLHFPAFLPVAASFLRAVELAPRPISTTPHRPSGVRQRIAV
jgi:ubiquinone/menaquinone biosynthesis C-methylase UbiE